MVLNAANLAQLSPGGLTKSGIENLIHEMMQKNQDRSLLNHLRNEITSLILALSQKTSSWCFDDAFVGYPSLFHSINDDSSKSGYSSNELSSSSNITADSNWQLRGKKRVRTSSGQSISDTVSQSSVDQSASDTVSQSTADQLRLDSNYITNSVSQDSNDQTSNHENGNENERRGLHGNMQGRGQWEWKSTVQRSVLKLDVLVLVNPSGCQFAAKHRKTMQNAANALKVVANSLQNTAKRRKTQQTHSRSSPIHLKLHKGF